MLHLLQHLFIITSSYKTLSWVIYSFIYLITYLLSLLIVHLFFTAQIPFNIQHIDPEIRDSAMDPDGDLITEADEPSPETFDNPALDASDEPIPETFDIPAPDASDEPIPETFDYPAPDACDEPTPHTSDEPTPETSGIGSLNGAELRPSRKSSVSSASSNSSASSISTVGVTEKDLKKG